MQYLVLSMKEMSNSHMLSTLNHRIEKHIMLQKQLFNTFKKHSAILNQYGFILHIQLYYSNVRKRQNILINVCFMLFKNHFTKKSCKIYIQVDWGRKCEGHVIISNLITQLKCSSSVASNLSGHKSWISALPVFSSNVHSQQISM